MRRAVAFILAVVLALGLFAVDAPPSAGTHNLAGRWDPQQYGIYNYAPCFRWITAAPTAFKYRVNDGRYQWNNAGTEFYIWPTTGTCTKDIEGNYADLGWPFDNVWGYVANDPIWPISFSTINFNSCLGSPCTPWYTGTGSVPSGYVDAWSIAVHEFGHLIAVNHSNLCDPTCSVMYSPFSTGQQRRYLNQHDKNSIRALYAYPAQ